MTEPAQEDGAVVGQVQTDTFCPHCGYNLHTRPVTRDERLGILVCRCPECGRYSAAGQTTTAARPWLNRLATILLAGWVFFLLILFGLCSLFLGMVAYGHTGEMISYQQTNYPRVVNGRMVYPSYGYYQLRYEIRQIPPGDVDQQTRHQWAQGWLTFFAILLGLITGVLFSAFVWHCKAWRRGMGFLPPIIGCGVAAVLWIGNPATEYIRGWGLTQIGAFFLIELIALAAGLATGRRVARGVVSVLVPPKARQHLAFLWITDGKVLTPT